MKKISEIKKEVELAEGWLRNIYKKDKRIQKWEGYRDALLWVLGKSEFQTAKEQEILRKVLGGLSLNDLRRMGFSSEEQDLIRNIELNL